MPTRPACRGLICPPTESTRSSAPACTTTTTSPRWSASFEQWRARLSRGRTCRPEPCSACRVPVRGTPQRNRNGGPNGIRTRVSALRGPCPRPLDDGAAGWDEDNWLGEEDSNLHYGVQSPASYH